MPSSNLSLAPRLVHLVHTTQPHRSVLDVGPGHGKYAVLLREYTEGIERLDAVEAWEPYIEAFNLRALYDHVKRDDVCNLSDAVLGAYDVVLMVDVLEHLEHDAGEALLRRIPGAVVICTPSQFFQNPEHEDIPPEAHRSLWTVKEFRALGADVAHVEQGGVIARLPRGR
jgi:2-polyprenyl-3-methyl-5-hydroxy-6-metoxy-1,4-benzoquinol methylase